jgi:putative addiction module component (TIGR02574 family)
MTNDAREILDRALKLPREARAALAAGLLESLESDPGEDQAQVDRAWADEIARRVRDVVDGRARTVDFDEALERLRRKRA